MAVSSRDSTRAPFNREPEDERSVNKNPPLEVPCICSIALFGFDSRGKRGPRQEALAKLKEVAAQHGISEFRWYDYFLALSLYSTLESQNNDHAFQGRGDNQPSSSSSTAANLSQNLNSEPEAIPSSKNLPYDDSTRRKESRPSAVDSSLCATQLDSSMPNETLSGKSSGSPVNTSSALKVQSSMETFNSLPNTNSLNDISEERNLSRQDPTSQQLEPKTDLLGNNETCLKHFDCTNKSEPNQKAEFCSIDNGKTNHDELTRSCLLSSNALPNIQSAASEKDSGAHMNADYVQLLYHMLRHADGIYGLPHTIATAPGISVMSLQDQKIISRRTGISSDDILIAEYDAETFMPAFYVAIDKKIRAIVICVRGTANIIDVLTDVAATQEPFQVELQSNKTMEGITHSEAEGKFNGFAHSGFLHSAKNVLDHAREAVQQATQDYPNFTVVTTGHSLGATTAAVLALLMRDKGGFPNAMGVVFAPAPCLSHDLAQLTSPFVLTIINGPDVIPRLSVSLLLSLFATIRYVGKLSPIRKLLLALGWQQNVVDWEKFNQFIDSCKAEWRELHNRNRLFIPGRVFQLIRRGAANHKWYKNSGRDGYVDVFRVPREKFLKIHTRQRGMLSAHWPVCYRRSLYLALKAHEQHPVSSHEIDSVMNRLAKEHNFKQAWDQFNSGPDPCVSFRPLVETEANMPSQK